MIAEIHDDLGLAERIRAGGISDHSGRRGGLGSVTNAETAAQDEAKPAPDGWEAVRGTPARRLGAFLARLNAIGTREMAFLCYGIEHPDAKMGDFAAACDCTTAHVTTLADSLSARGMVRRLTVAGDRRKVGVVVTRKGQAEVEAAIQAAAEVAGRVS